MCNGHIAELGERADPDKDVIELDGERLQSLPEKVYLMLHKPRGYVTTMSDEKGRRTVCELVAGCGARVHPVGRLDLNSEGLLLMTNDGDFANRIMHPAGDIPKTYLVWVHRFAPEKLSTLSTLRSVDGAAIARPELHLLSAKGEDALLRLTIHEGRNRQIRKMCALADLTVTRLRRVSEGPLQLGDLPVGAWRPLTAEEVARILG